MLQVTMLSPFFRLFVFLVLFLVDCVWLEELTKKKEVLVSKFLAEFSSSLNMGHSTCIFPLLWLTIQGFFIIGSSLSSSGLIEYLFCTLLDSLWWVDLLFGSWFLLFDCISCSLMTVG